MSLQHSKSQMAHCETDCITTRQRVRDQCSNLGYPLMVEYDFRRDNVTPALEIDLRPTTTIRPYQEKSLREMFSTGYV
jgi:DNA excision repair protein ERCC-3